MITKFGYRYLITASTDKNKEALIKHTKPWDKIYYLIKKTSGGEAGDYLKKISKFNQIQMIISL